MHNYMGDRSDSHTKVSHRDNPGFFQQIQQSFCATVIGILLVIASFPVIYWNEVRVMLYSVRCQCYSTVVNKIGEKWGIPLLVPFTLLLHLPWHLPLQLCHNIAIFFCSPLFFFFSLLIPGPCPFLYWVSHSNVLLKPFVPMHHECMTFVPLHPSV